MGLFWACVLIGILQFAIVVPAFFLQEDLWRDALLALSGGLAASAAWWAFFSRYAEREGKRFLTGQLDAQRELLGNELKVHRDLLSESIQNEAQRWRDLSLPRDVYPAAEGFDLRLNRDLTTNLELSHSYFFCGPSGVYVPARIILRPNGRRNALREVRLRIVDPRSDLAMEQAIADRRLRAVHAAKSAEEIRNEVIDDIFMTVVGLWEARRKVKRPILLWYESTALIVRVELFDDCVYDSSIDVPSSESFPLTVAWSQGQASWITRNQEFRQQQESTASLRISTGTQESTVQDHLDLLAGELGRPRVTVAGLRERYREEYLGYLARWLPKAAEHDEVVEDLTEDGHSEI